MGLHQSIARLSGFRCTATEVPEAIERLLRAYLAQRNGGENLREYFARYTNDELRSQLAGAVVEAEVRDISAGPVPHGVGDNADQMSEANLFPMFLKLAGRRRLSSARARLPARRSLPCWNQARM